MRYFIVAGETSGDIHAAALMRGLIAKDAEAEFAYFGGDAMASVAPGMVLHCRELAIMGFWEVLMGLRKILRNLRICLRAIDEFQPDAVILVDFPGFNFRVAKACKLRGIPVLYYIAPKVWAWKEGRIKRLKAYVDQLFIIFPFEIEYFKRHGIQAIYEGNPLMDELPLEAPTPGEFQSFCQKHGLDSRPKIALLPGSRLQEIKATLARMGNLSERYPDYQFLVAAAPSIDSQHYAQVLARHPRLVLVQNDTHALMRHATAGIITSGTATLEAALLTLPEVVVYGANPISGTIARLLVRLEWVSLVNLVLQREAVPELLLEEFNIRNLDRELQAVLPEGDKRDRMLEDFAQLRTAFGKPGASLRIASRIIQILRPEARS